MNQIIKMPQAAKVQTMSLNDWLHEIKSIQKNQINQTNQIK